jgi:hypothetical protein
MDAFLAVASLRAANLCGLYRAWRGSDGADLSDADLRGTEGLTQPQIDQAHSDSGTRRREFVQGPISRRGPPLQRAFLISPRASPATRRKVPLIKRSFLIHRKT